MDKGIYSQQTELFGSAIHQTTCITGKGVPTPYIQGAVGCLYMDEDSYKTYKCVSTKDGQCVWEPVGLGGDSTAIKNTAIGDVIWLTDSAEAPLQSMKIYGKTTQDGTPTPENPIELVSVGDSGSTTEYVMGGNLFDGALEAGAIDSSTGTNIATAGGKRSVNYTPILPNTTYTISREDTTKNIRLRFYDKNKNYIGYGFSAKVSPFTFTAKDDYAYMRLDLVGSDINEKVQVVLGSTEKPYEPYKEQSLTIPTPNGLPGIPVSSGGNYTDSNGQQYVCGEVDCKKDVQKQLAYELVLTGDEDIEEMGSMGPAEIDMKLHPPIVPPSTESPCLCTHYVTGTMSQVWDGTVRNIIVSYNNAIQIQTSGFASAEEFKSWLKSQYEAGTPVKIVYILAEPIETPLTEEEIQAYKALHTNYPNTTIYNSDGAGAEVEYVADTKNYIDNKIADEVAKLTAAIITE